MSCRRRTWGKASFSDKYYHETLTKELLEQVRSIKKFGGFYLSRFNISRGIHDVPQSKKGEKPLVDVSFEEAKKIAGAII